MDLFDLTGRNALVTGASRGIGLAIARALGQRGASVTITGRKEETLRAVAERLRAEGVDARPIVCHQGDLAAIVSLFEQLDRDRHTPDVVVVNADYARRADEGTGERAFYSALDDGSLGYQVALRRRTDPRVLLDMTALRRDGRDRIWSNLDKVDPEIVVYRRSVSR